MGWSGWVLMLVFRVGWTRRARQGADYPSSRAEASRRHAAGWKGDAEWPGHLYSLDHLTILMSASSQTVGLAFKSDMGLGWTLN